MDNYIRLNIAILRKSMWKNQGFNQLTVERVIISSSKAPKDRVLTQYQFIFLSKNSNSISSRALIFLIQRKKTKG